MNKYIKIALVCGALAACMLLSACGQFGGGREQIDNVLDKIYGTNGSETAAPEGSTEASKPEPVVRYDYMANDMSAFVSLSKEQYQAFEINVGKEYLVTDEIVELQLKNLMYQYATATNGTEKVTDQPIQYGDKVYIYYRGEVDGKEFSGGSNMNNSSPYALGIGSGSFIPGFEEGLIGVVPSETSKDKPYPVHVTFPEGYKDSELAGKDAIFYVVVEYFVKYEIPELTDKFVEETLKYKHEGDLPDEEGALVDAYKASIKAKMEESARASAEQQAYPMAMSQLMDKLTFTAYPEGEVESYYNSYIKEFESYYAYYKTLYGYSSLDEFAVDYMGLEKGADWKAELTKSCQKTVQQSILVHAIAEVEGIEQISDEEFKAELDYLVEYYKQYNYTAEYIREQMGDDAIKESALFGKIEKLIMERITIKYE
ncbi:MAG: FKBP-type peptidyl-prolyl cis-trans isomerase [Clostridia bacterium]|nr:FKBP-type peptidyl-prolyl cis-trans isomerase [Clostridia bacterium]